MTNFIIYVLIFLFGGAIGSFVGVVVDRLYVKSFLAGRSNCDSCNRRLDWYETIPVFSYLFLKGRCRKCKVKIGKEKLWLELLGGIFSLLFYKVYLIKYLSQPFLLENTVTLILFSILGILLFIIFFVIIFYDLKHKLVPTGFTLSLLIIGVAFEVYRVFNYKIFYGSIDTLFWLDIFSGLLVALPFFLIYYFSKKRGIGFGDVLIYIGVGYMAGFIFGLSIFFISVWLGAIVSLLLILVYPKKYNRKTAIPFAPFILISTILVAVFQIDILGLIQLFG